jgi:choline transport protein
VENKMGSLDLENSMLSSNISPRASIADRLIAATEGIGTVDDINLEHLGIHEERTRDIGLIAIIGAGWNICNNWADISATLALSIMSGGSVTLVYAVIVIIVVVGSSALSMAEMASVWPTAGGQYQ